MKWTKNVNGWRLLDSQISQALDSIVEKLIERLSGLRRAPVRSQ